MGTRCRRAAASSESGTVLLETLISLPLLIMLLVAIGSMAVFGAREYLNILADAELRQEIQIALQRVTDDALEAKTIRYSTDRNHESGISIIKRTNPWITGYASEETGVEYWLNNIEGTKKLVKDSARAPMTGNHALASVSITEFSCTEVAPGLYRFSLRGRSGVTKNEYGLTTAIYIPGE